MTAAAANLRAWRGVRFSAANRIILRFGHVRIPSVLERREFGHAIGRQHLNIVSARRHNGMSNTRARRPLGPSRPADAVGGSRISRPRCATHVLFSQVSDASSTLSLAVGDTVPSSSAGLIFLSLSSCGVGASSATCPSLQQLDAPVKCCVSSQCKNFVSMQLLYA